MRPFETLATVTTPEGRRLTLHRRDRDYFIHLDGEELMSSRAPGSEVALAELALAEWAAAARASPERTRRRSARGVPRRAAVAGGHPIVLIGGLGLGYTLRAALDRLPPRGRIVVAEVFAAVVEWNRGPLATLHGRALDDRRVRVVEADVGEVLATGKPWDLVLLDVDNGPDAWCLAANGRLYDRAGIGRLRDALAPGGVLAVWSAQPDPRFARSLERGGFAARSVSVRARGRKGARHTIFLAHRREGRR